MNKNAVLYTIRDALLCVIEFILIVFGKLLLFFAMGAVVILVPIPFGWLLSLLYPNIIIGFDGMLAAGLALLIVVAVIAFIIGGIAEIVRWAKTTYKAYKY